MVELTEALAGPYCAMLLGDFGADVIKVERPGTGDQTRGWGPPFVGSESAYYLGTNRNKRSITINYDEPLGQEILQRLVATADVFLCNQPVMQSLTRRGIDPASLRAKHPRLIYCSISGYGFSGPKAEKRGYDILAQAEAGIMSFTGEPGSGPMRFPIAIADMTTGMYAAMAVLAALFARERTGQGEFVELALFDSQLTWLANVGSSYLNAGVSPERWGNAHPSIVPYQLFRGSDGRYFVVAIGTEPQWRRLLRVLGVDGELGQDARFADNAARIQNRNELIPRLQQLFEGRESFGLADEAGRSGGTRSGDSKRERSIERRANAGAGINRGNRASDVEDRAEHSEPDTLRRATGGVPAATTASGRTHRRDSERTEIYGERSGAGAGERLPSQKRLNY